MKRKEVEILQEPGGGKYKLWLILGMAAVVLIMVGLLIWKGPALLHQPQTNNADNSDLNDYTPTKKH